MAARKSSTTDLSLPVSRGRGRPTKAQQAIDAERKRVWCAAIMEIKGRLDFEIGTREWCYLLEESGLSKSDFDKAEGLLVECRKAGLLPLDIVIEDNARRPAGLETIDGKTVEGEALAIIDYVNAAHEHYTPVSFWENQRKYVEVIVEKASLRSLFEQPCERYHVPVSNFKGWGDLHSRANLLRRFSHWQLRGKKCVLCYCGDFDPHGLRISRNLRSNLREMLPALALEGVEVDVESIEGERFGLNDDFIEEHGLTWIEGLATGGKDMPNLENPRHPQHHHADIQDYLRRFGARKVEASTLVTIPDIARDLCERAILRHIDVPAIKTYNRKLAKLRRELGHEIQHFILNPP
jgi:hypothetical protein